MNSEFLRVLVIHVEDAFIAQCLEHDISVQATDLDTLQRRFETAVQLEHENLAEIDEAPAEFFRQWELARELGGAPENTQMRLAA